MSKKNPFKSIEPDISLPEDLKEEIIQEVEEIIQEEGTENASDTEESDLNTEEGNNE
ncbi:hypothetical protein [Flagellimonas flava]|uniref:hypothetical protein n=1 Tax=Flagellimonas flava TaxID=570519 RepID=UPI003D65CE80